MRTALENDRVYELPAHHDPIKLLFDATVHLGEEEGEEEEEEKHEWWW